MYMIKACGPASIELYAHAPEFLGEMVQEVGRSTGYAPTVSYSDDLVIEEYAAVRVEGKMMEIMVVKEDGHPFCFSAGLMMPPSEKDTLKTCLKWFESSVKAMADMNENPGKGMLDIIADAVDPSVDLAGLVKRFPMLLDL